MTENQHCNRYPGLRPFRDAEPDRRLFFGREWESNALCRQILNANFAILFGKTGVGKTSLLQAGVFPRLRQQSVLPLPVYLERTEAQPLHKIIGAIAECCHSAGVHYAPGETGTLRAFLDTTVFRREGVVQTPVLVLDRFEQI